MPPSLAPPPSGTDFPVLGSSSVCQQPQAQAGGSRLKAGPSYIATLRKGTTAARTAAMIRYLPAIEPSGRPTETILQFIWVRDVRPQTTRGHVPSLRDLRNVFAESLGCRLEDFICAKTEGRDVLFLVTANAATYLQALLAKPTEQWLERAPCLLNHPMVTMHFAFDRFSGTSCPRGKLKDSPNRTAV